MAKVSRINFLLLITAGMLTCSRFPTIPQAEAGHGEEKEQKRGVKGEAD